MRVLNFNAAASSAFADRNASKVRLAVRDGVMFIRPTDRKASPHLADIRGSKSKGFTVEIPDSQLEKCGAEAVLAADSNFGLRPDKYGWFALTQADAEGNVEGAKISVAHQDEKPAEQPAA